MTAKFRPRALEFLSDEEIVQWAQVGERSATDHLLKKYRPIVLFKSRSFFIQGDERDDMIQEGMIGLYKAIRDFNPKRRCSFHTFADMCIARQMITALKRHGPLRQSLVVYAHALRGRWHDDDAEQDMAEATPGDQTTNPEYTTIAREDCRLFRARLRERLSPFEWNIFCGFVGGMSYQQIADRNLCTAKSVDNALCRVRRKTRRFLPEDGDDAYAT